MSLLKNPIIVALDVDDVGRASELVSLLSGKVGGFKVGPRLTLKSDSRLTDLLQKSGVYFFDHKFFDIPSTTAASVRAAFDLGATWVTVHALNGGPCLKELSILQEELRAKRPDFRVLAVTVLTSFTESSLPPIWKRESVESSVEQLAKLASDNGIGSFVSSAHELPALKKNHPYGFFVVPGIRPANSKSQDQARVATPAEAIKMGASALVIGRPIVEAKDPVQVVDEVLKSL